jgi:hypothetical protein
MLERKSWRQGAWLLSSSAPFTHAAAHLDHPFNFVAKCVRRSACSRWLTSQQRPQSRPDGSVDLLKWDCQIPGKKGTSSEPGWWAASLQLETGRGRVHILPPTYFPLLLASVFRALWLDQEPGGSDRGTQEPAFARANLPTEPCSWCFWS